ncbi:MAG: zinc-dependent metalloprotease [Bdellovibrionaceae bacterium]|nr:zinc-dependent metalloprotease [Pseudobdellovibrionaceae bacterium]
MKASNMTTKKMKSSFLPFAIVSALNLTLALSLTLTMGCAKERPVERNKDPERNNLVKDAFTVGLAKTGTPERKIWNSKVTVVRTSTNGGFAFVGFQSDARLGYFEFTRDKLKFFDAVSLYQPKGSVLPELINSWSVTHHDFKLAESDGNVTSKETEDPDKRWDQKRYFQVDWSKAEIAENGTFPAVYWQSYSDCWAPKASHLADDSLKIEPDAIHFTVAVDYVNSCPSAKRMMQSDFTYTVHYKYSFWERQVSPNFKPSAYKGESDPEMKRFGFFQTVVERMNETRGLPENVILKNIWNPNREFVDIYFAPGVKEEYKWYFNDPKVGAIARTNEVLAKAGAKLRFRMWNNDDGPPAVKGKVKEFGDGRYSFVNFVEEIDPGGAPLGYGPSDADPLTGEILTSNTIIWTGYLKYYLQRIADQQDRQKTQSKDSTLYAHMRSLLEEPEEEWVNRWDLTRGHGKAYQEILPNVTYGYTGWGRFTSSAPKADALADKLFEFKSLEKLQRRLPDKVVDMKPMFALREGARRALSKAIMEASDRRTVQTYPVQPVLSQARKMVLDGQDAKKVLQSILHRVAIHEFGHNLGLRHNFYGSVDSANFGHFHDHEPVAHGTANAQVSHTSSVMDYMDLEHETDVAYNWEPYDVAALSHAYSYGKVEPTKSYLFCTDEHTILNALCNRFDYGSTPSEVAMSMIRTYDDSYHVRNYRYNRQYWNTSGYDDDVFWDMYNMKKFLLLWRRALDRNTVGEELSRKGLSPEDVEETAKLIGEDAKKAVRLTIAFFDAVIQQKASDRPYDTEYDLFSGEVKRVGILSDKVYAMLFFMGNDGLPYHPNKPMSYASFMTFQSEPEFANLLDNIYENQLTTRVDMQPWFINSTRALYSITSTDSYNIDDSGNIDRIQVQRYTAVEMKSNFGIEVGADKDAHALRLGESRVAGFAAGDEVGYVEINGLYYLVGKQKNPYAYGIVNSILNDDAGGASVAQGKADLMEMYNLYFMARQDRR